MADNINVTPGTGASIAADDIGGNLHQRVKISVGADGAANDLQPPDADGKAVTSILSDGGMVYNGATWDRERGNLEGTLLASAARTATTSSATQTNYNARGVLVFLHVTAASGTGGLTVQIQGLANGFGYNLNASPTAVTTTALSVYEIYPGATGTSTNVPQRTSGSLPRSWAVSVVHGDASSYTYAVYYALIL